MKLVGCNRLSGTDGACPGQRTILGPIIMLDSIEIDRRLSRTTRLRIQTFDAQTRHSSLPPVDGSFRRPIHQCLGGRRGVACRPMVGRLVEPIERPQWNTSRSDPPDRQRHVPSSLCGTVRESRSVRLSSQTASRPRIVVSIHLVDSFAVLRHLSHERHGFPEPFSCDVSRKEGQWSFRYDAMKRSWTGGRLSFPMFLSI